MGGRRVARREYARAGRALRSIRQRTKLAAATVHGYKRVHAGMLDRNTRAANRQAATGVERDQWSEIEKDAGAKRITHVYGWCAHRARKIMSIVNRQPSTTEQAVEMCFANNVWGRMSSRLKTRRHAKDETIAWLPLYNCTRLH